MPKPSKTNKPKPGTGEQSPHPQFCHFKGAHRWETGPRAYIKIQNHKETLVQELIIEPKKRYSLEFRSQLIWGTHAIPLCCEINVKITGNFAPLRYCRTPQTALKCRILRPIHFVCTPKVNSKNHMLSGTTPFICFYRPNSCILHCKLILTS